MKFGDNTKVEKFFKNVNVPEVTIPDVNYLIGEGDINFTFENSNGGQVYFKFGINSSLEQLLNYYFAFIGKEHLKGNKDISFIYNAKCKKGNFLKTKVRDFFQNQDNPYIMVLDPNKLI